MKASPVVCETCWRVQCNCPRPIPVVALMLAFILSVMGCPGSSLSPLHPDASPDGSAPLIDGGDAFDAACARLVALGCTQIAPQFCASSMRDSVGNVGAFDTACLASAQSRAAVRACDGGKVDCPE